MKPINKKRWERFARQHYLRSWPMCDDRWRRKQAKKLARRKP